MKNIIFALCFILLISPAVSAEEIISPFQCLDLDYIGVEYGQAVKREKPLILIFASSHDIGSLLRIFSIGKFIYKEYKNDFNFTILNTESRQNKELIAAYTPKSIPALYIINTKDKSFIYIEKKFYKKRDLKIILDNYKKRTS